MSVARHLSSGKPSMLASGLPAGVGGEAPLALAACVRVLAWREARDATGGIVGRGVKIGDVGGVVDGSPSMRKAKRGVGVDTW